MSCCTYIILYVLLRHIVENHQSMSLIHIILYVLLHHIVENHQSMRLNVVDQYSGSILCIAFYTIPVRTMATKIKNKTIKRL